MFFSSEVFIPDLDHTLRNPDDIRARLIDHHQAGSGNHLRRGVGMRLPILPRFTNLLFRGREEPGL
jgi:hypothetical protein